MKSRYHRRVGVLGVWMLLAALAWSAPLSDYQARLQQGLSRLQAASPKQRLQVLEQLTWLLPQTEEVSFGQQTVQVDNAWLHNFVEAFMDESDPHSRDALYNQIQAHLTVLLEQVNQVDPKPSPSQRPRLMAILNRSEFLHSHSNSPFQRFRRWMSGQLSRLFDWLPGWQHDHNPWTGGLKVVVWIMIGLVGFLLARSLLRRAHRATGQKPPHPPVLLGVQIAPHATPKEFSIKAGELAERGDYRGAVRYLYIALLYHLHQHGVIQLDASSTNHEYVQRLRHESTLFSAVQSMTHQFDSIWYGQQMPSEQHYQSFYQQYQTTVTALSHR